jgi:hypothetical protein
MSTLSKLKFVSSTRQPKYGKSTPVQRRSKLATRIDEQVAILTALIAGTDYEVMQTKKAVNKLTGEAVMSTAAKRIKNWFWTDGANKVNCQVQYGAMKLELGSKGCNAIQTSSLKELVAALQLIKTAAMVGELDGAIDAALAARKAKAKSA